MTTAPLDAPDNATIPGQVEIPYIPSNQRQSHFAPVSDDTIVLVGQARQKKRKRTKPKVIDNSSIGDRENSGDDEIFDYATVPNLLDDVKPAPEDLSTRKKKKQKDAKGTCYLRHFFLFFSSSKFPLVTSFAASFFRPNILYAYVTDGRFRGNRVRCFSGATAGYARGQKRQQDPYV